MLLYEKLKNKTLILASKSPRRYELLRDAGLDFTLGTGYDVEEVYSPDTPADEVPLFLAGLKSEAYPEQLKDNDILITADTVVILDGEILGKPADRADAIRILERLSGRQHTVITGIVLRDNKKHTGFAVGTKVWFRELHRDEIEYYVDTYRPYDKAGAYGIQEWIGYVGITRVEGSFYNVVGLPVQSLYANLLNFI